MLMLSDMSADSPPELAGLCNELAEVSIGQVKKLVVQLGVGSGKCDDVDSYPVPERKQKLLDTWLREDSHSTWSKLVDALNQPSVGEHTLANKIRVKYCATPPSPHHPTPPPHHPEQPPHHPTPPPHHPTPPPRHPTPPPHHPEQPPTERPPLHRTRGTTISETDERQSSIQSRGSLETNASSISFDTASPFSPINGSSSFSSSVEETQSAARSSHFCACGDCSFQDFLYGKMCPHKLDTQTGLPYLDTGKMSRFEKDIFKGRLLNESSDIRRSFDDLVDLTADALIESDVKPRKLARFLRNIEEEEPQVRKVSVPAFNYSEEFKQAKSVEDILDTIRPHYSFFNFKVIELIIKSNLIPPEDPKEVRKQLQCYEAKFNSYCKRRVYECPPVYNERDKASAIVFCKWDEDINDKFTVKGVQVFKAKLVKALEINTLALDLVSVDVGCVQLVWQIPKHLCQHVFPLCIEQERKLHEMGLLQLFCWDFKYTASAYTLKLDLNRMAQKLKSIEGELRSQLSEKENDDRAFLKQFRIVVLNTKITSKQSDPPKLVKGYWRDILDSQSTATMLGKLKPFWDITNPALLDDLVEKFGDEVVKRRMSEFQIKLKQIFEHDAVLLDYQIACARREDMSLPRNFTSIFKIQVPQATSELSLKEIEHYHDTLLRCALFHLAVLRFVPGEPTHSRSAVLTWHLPSNGVDIMKEYFDESLFYSSRLEIESVTLDNKPMQDFKEYQKVLKLITACRKNDMSALTKVLESGVDPNLANQEQATPLTTACQLGFTDAVRALLKAKADVNLRAQDLTPLNLASYRGHLEAVQILLDSGAHVDALDEDDHTPLHRACFNGNTAVAELLIKYGADYHKTCNDGSSVLHQAANNGHCDTVKLLLTKYKIPIHVTDNKGGTALHWVSYRGHVQVMELLIETQRELIDIQDSEGLSPLMIAANTGHAEAVKLLVEYCPELNAQDKEGLTALMMASQHGYCEIVDSLVKAHADVNICENTVGWSALFFAAKEGHLNVAKLLVKYGANIALRDKNNTVALDQARVHGRADLCDVLTPAMLPKQKSTPQLHTLMDKLKQTSEMMKQKVNRIDNWLKSTVKKEEYYQRQSQEVRQKQIKAFSIQ